LYFEGAILINQISVAQLHQWLGDAQREDKPIILDVREDWEYEHAKLAGSVHIPMGQITQRLHELPTGKTIACLCHHGSRSMQVGQYLSQQGFNEVLNIHGGIHAWSIEIDGSLPTY
jgi:rhodanese-related sulfurtransferase